jgi:hypothetical protein
LRKLAVILFILFTIWLACFLVARRLFIKERDNGWTATGGSLMGFGARFPTQETNEAAQDLEETAARIGIDLVPKAEAPNRERGEFDAYRKTSQMVKEYGNAQVENKTLDQPSPELMEFLIVHEDEIRKAAEQLLSASPRWTSDVAKGFDAPMPNLLGHINLNRVLVAAALHEASQRRHGEAWRLLEAADRLADSAERRPDTLSILIGISEKKLITGAVRLLEPPVPDWAIAPDLDQKGNAVLALQGEAYQVAVFFEEAGVSELLTKIPNQKPNIGQRLVSALISPYVLFGGANTLHAYKLIVDDVASGDPCASSPPITPIIADWNVFGKAYMGDANYAVEWGRLNEYLVHHAGTRLILQLKSGVSPDSVNPCREGWTHAAQPDGTTLVRYEKPLDPPQRSGAIKLPTEYIVRK